jgi:hypothetical protein
VRIDESGQYETSEFDGVPHRAVDEMSARDPQVDLLPVRRIGPGNVKIGHPAIMNSPPM